MSRVFVSGLLLFAAFGGKSLGADSPETAMEWRVLLIIKPETDVKVDGKPAVKTRLPKDNIEAVTKAFQDHTPYWISKISEGRLKWKADVVVSQIPITTVSPIGTDVHWVAPGNGAEDIKAHVPRGKYDGVFVYWKAVDDSGKGLNPGFGWSIGPNDGANHCGFSCVHHAATSSWGRDTEITEVFVHEWLHQLEAFYSAKGVKLPKGGLHVDASYGYKHDPKMFWKPWYRDFIAGDVKEPDGTRTGLGDKAWELGSIREEQQIYLPDFLTPEVRKANLLRNGSYEESASGSWTVGSWKNNSKAGQLTESKVARAGKKVAVLTAKEPDDAHLRQSVAVKPKTRYLLCGWAKTEKIEAGQEGATVGANLSILGGFERSSAAMLGTNDWTYLCFVFDSADRTTIDVAVRLGHHSSTVTGAASFDDIVLIELPSRPAGKNP